MNPDQPVQYQKGWVEFYKLRFKVTPDTLIPRPETELLVDEVLNFLRDKKYDIRNTILDLGTGAGAIAISIAVNNPICKITATEISEKALEVARENARINNVENKITFIQSDLLENVSQEPDIIVTNLPYIPTERIPYLDSSVKDYEPHVALDGGQDGFGLYRKLFEQINDLGWKPKLIVSEIDYTHGELALSEAQKYFPEAECEIKLDLHHKQRILIIRFIG